MRKTWVYLNNVMKFFVPFLLLSCTTPIDEAGRPLNQNYASSPSVQKSGNADNASPTQQGKSATSNDDIDAEGQKNLFPGTGKFLGSSKKSTRHVGKIGNNIVLNFENAELRDVVEVILGQTLKVNYLYDPRVEGSVSLKTTGPLPANIILEILETMLRMNNAALVVDDNLYKVVPVGEVIKGNLVPEIAEGGEVIPAGFSVRLIPLEYISVLQMDKLLEPFLPQDSVVRVDVDRNILVLAAAGHEMTKLLETVELFDVDWLKGKSVGIFRLATVNVETVVEELTTIFGTGAEGPLEGVIRFVPISRLNGVLVMTTRPGYLERAEIWINRLDKGNGTGQNLYVYSLQHGKAADLAGILTDLFSDRRSSRDSTTGKVAPGRQPVTLSSANKTNTPSTTAARNNQTKPNTTNRPVNRRTTGTAEAKGDGLAFSPDANIKIIADEVNNALLILSSEQDYRMVKAALRKLDIVPLQVLIEATIAEVTLTDELRFGLQWLFNTGSLGDGLSGDVRLSNGSNGSLSATFPGFSTIITNSAGGIRGVLDALEGVTTVNVISSPHLMVLDNRTAELNVGDEVPVVTQQQQSTINNSSNLVNTVQFRDTGVILRVTPRVSASGSINMEIEQEVSSVVQSIDSGQLTPTISQRKVKSSIVAQTGETIVLGGLISDEETVTRSGVPFLSRIPLLGNAFRRSEKSAVRKELLVLITPKVVRNASEARRVTQELRDRLQGLRDLDDRTMRRNNERDSDK